MFADTSLSPEMAHENRSFQSPRGRGRNNPGWGRADGKPFVSLRVRIAERIVQQRRSQLDTAPSAPSYGSYKYSPLKCELQNVD